jgi:hypothetical protein
MHLDIRVAHRQKKVATPTISEALTPMKYRF